MRQEAPATGPPNVIEDLNLKESRNIEPAWLSIADTAIGGMIKERGSGRVSKRSGRAGPIHMSKSTLMLRCDKFNIIVLRIIPRFVNYPIWADLSQEG